MKIPVIRLLPHNSPHLMCANREPWMGRHPLCDAMADQMVAAFHAAVARGEFNAQGYTPNEWKAKMRQQEGRHEHRDD
jgi:hypothetical protein